MPNFNDLQTAISNVSGVQLDDNYRYWSSTESGGSFAWCVATGDGCVVGSGKGGDNYVRAFLAL